MKYFQTKALREGFQEICLHELKHWSLSRQIKANIPLNVLPEGSKYDPTSTFQQKSDDVSKKQIQMKAATKNQIKCLRWTFPIEVLKNNRLLCH